MELAVHQTYNQPGQPPRPCTPVFVSSLVLLSCKFSKFNICPTGYCEVSIPFTNYFETLGGNGRLTVKYE